MRRVVVGLGNPGARYEMTRHNMGALVVRAFAERHNLTFKREVRYRIELVKSLIQSVSVHLVIPTTYMNESGSAVQGYLNHSRFLLSDLVIVCDDVSLPFGTLRLRAGGSAGGHNGLKSIETHLNTQQYARLRLGVGQPDRGQELADYVLERFTRQEMEQLPLFVARGVACLNTLLTQSVESAMNLVNSKDWHWSLSSHEQ